MKTITNLKNLFPLSILFLLQGCTAYYKIDAEKFFKNQKYESDKPFKMRDGSIQAPLLSQKGQFNITLESVIDNIDYSTPDGRKKLAEKFILTQ